VGRGSGIDDTRRFVNYPVFPCRAHPQEGNCYAWHSGSWEESKGCIADVHPSTPRDDLGSYYSGREVQMMGCYAMALCL
jgi:hypothetical protein